MVSNSSDRLLHPTSGNQSTSKVVDAYLTGRFGLLRIAQRILGDLDDAEDVVQDVFYRVLKRSGCTAEYRYLVTAVRNGAISRLRRSRLVNGTTRISNDTLSLDPEVTLDLLDKREQANSVFACIYELPSRMRIVATLHWIEGRSCREIGESLGLSRKTVENHLTRARKMVVSRGTHH